MRDTRNAQKFANQFEALLGTCPSQSQDVNIVCSSINNAFAAAEEAVLPRVLTHRSKPWISDVTLALIDQRRHAAIAGDLEQEMSLRKAVKKPARTDRRIWLVNLASSGSWVATKKLRQGAVRNQGRLNDVAGQPISSEMRADRFAEYLEEVQ